MSSSESASLARAIAYGTANGAHYAVLLEYADETVELALAVGGLAIVWARFSGMVQHCQKHEELAAADGIEE